MKNFKILVFVMFVAFAIVACQSNEEPLEQKTELSLPKVINIISAEKMPAEVQTRSGVNVIASAVAGTYNGKLYDVKMNKKEKKDVQNIKIDIKAEGIDKFHFILKPFRIGRMPGKLSVDIPNISLNSDGTFHADKVNNASLLSKKLTLVAWFGKPKYDVTLIEGSFIPVAAGYKLKLTLESEGSIFNISIFKAHVKYDGNKE